MPMNCDVDLAIPAHRAEMHSSNRWAVLGVISAGGVLGALARYALETAFPRPAGTFGWTVFTINVVGCALIGILMVLVQRVWHGQLIRPFLGVGVLGGFTTFSTYIGDIQVMIAQGHPRTALAYLAGTLFAALLAVWAAMELTIWLVRPRAPAIHAPGQRR
jgi:CrcB protein